ncbi:MAG: leucine-rich repeat protein, partial [Clostridia bacterium]|nr:leucine-rich repeat protein [Clostridia bacterium]
MLFSHDNAYTVGSVNYASSAGTGNSITRIASWQPQQGNYAPWYSYASSISQVLTIGDHEIGFAWFFGNFYNCTALTTVDLSGVALDTLCSFSYGFYNCSSLTSLDFTGFDLKYTDNFQYTFYNCSNLSTLNMSFKDMPLGQNSLTSTFENCGSLTSLDLSGANTANVRKLPNTFKNCTSLTSLNLTGLDFSKVTDISSAFENCSSLTSLDLSTVGTSLTNANNALNGCTSLETVILSQSLVNTISTTGLFDSVDTWYDYNGIYTASSPMTKAGTYYFECPHNWIRQGAAADQCLGGTENYKCKICEDTKTETKTGDGHTPGAAATCTTDQTCTVCGTVIVNKTGHSYSDDWSSDATNHWHAATCGHTNEKSGIAVHTWDGGAVTKQAKCNEEGVTTYTCTVCSKTKTEPIPKTSHDPETIPAEAATCTSGGKTAGEKCSVCGTVITA